jgi:hypothetical protein
MGSQDPNQQITASDLVEAQELPCVMQDRALVMNDARRMNVHEILAEQGREPGHVVFHERLAPFALAFGYRCDNLVCRLLHQAVLRYFMLSSRP